MGALLFPFSSFWQVQVPYTKSQFQRFRAVHWAVQIRFHSYLFSRPLVHLYVASKCSSFTIFLKSYVALLFFLSFLLLLTCTPQTYLRTASLVGFFPHTSILSRLRCPAFPSSSFFYFLPYSPISYGWQPLFRHVPYFVLPVQLSRVSISFKWVHSEFCS